MTTSTKRDGYLATEDADQLLAEQLPHGTSIFAVTAVGHPNCPDCESQIDPAISTARLTGSVGGTHSTQTTPDPAGFHTASVQRLSWDADRGLFVAVKPHGSATNASLSRVARR